MVFLFAVDLGFKWRWQRWTLGQRWIHSGKTTLYLLCVQLLRSFSDIFSVMFCRPCILFIVQWKRNLSQLRCQIPSSPHLKGKKLQVLCQALWQCCLLCQGLWLAQVLARSHCEALLHWIMLPFSAQALSASLRNTPLGPARRYVTAPIHSLFFITVYPRISIHFDTQRQLLSSPPPYYYSNDRYINKK